MQGQAHSKCSMNTALIPYSFIQKGNTDASSSKNPAGSQGNINRTQTLALHKLIVWWIIHQNED